jgi:hypothetical protein
MMPTTSEEDEDPIKAYTHLPGLYRTFRVKTDSSGHGKIYLEGHDISHMVRRYNMESSVNEANTVTLELIGLEFG